MQTTISIFSAIVYNSSISLSVGSQEMNHSIELKTSPAFGMGHSTSDIVLGVRNTFIVASERPHEHMRLMPVRQTYSCEAIIETCPFTLREDESAGDYENEAARYDTGDGNDGDLPPVTGSMSSIDLIEYPREHDAEDAAQLISFEGEWNQNCAPFEREYDPECEEWDFEYYHSRLFGSTSGMEVSTDSQCSEDIIFPDWQLIAADYRDDPYQAQLVVYRARGRENECIWLDFPTEGDALMRQGFVPPLDRLTLEDVEGKLKELIDNWDCVDGVRLDYQIEPLEAIRHRIASHPELVERTMVCLVHSLTQAIHIEVNRRAYKCWYLKQSRASSLAFETIKSSHDGPLSEWNRRDSTRMEVLDEKPLEGQVDDCPPPGFAPMIIRSQKEKQESIVTMLPDEEAPAAGAEESVADEAEMPLQQPGTFLERDVKRIAQPVLVQAPPFSIKNMCHSAQSQQNEVRSVDPIAKRPLKKVGFFRRLFCCGKLSN